MPMISYNALKRVLEKNSDIEFILPVPSCPKNADTMCFAIVDNCDSGNRRRCEQWLEFYYEGRSIYRLKVMFKVSSSVNDGYVRFEDMQVRKMFQKKIVKRENLEQLEL